MCGYVLRDFDVPVTIGATAGAPPCPYACRAGTPQALPVRMIPIPGIGRMDVGAVKGAAFQKFDIYDGLNRKVTIDSVHKLRTVERESEKMAADGIGQPIVFRAWAQERTNRDVHTLGKLDAGERPDPKYVQKFGPALRSAAEPDTGFGPGVDESNTSALPMAGGE